MDYELGHAVVWDTARRFGVEVVQAILAGAEGRETWFNVNFPHCPPDEVSGIRVVASQRFSRSPMRYYESDNSGKFFIAIPETPAPLDTDSDFHLLMHENAITVTPVSLQPSDLAVAGRLDGKLVLKGS